MTTPSLGRLAAPDPRDLGHLLRAARPFAFEVSLSDLPRSLRQPRGPILDQGQTSCCVEFSLRAKLMGSPVRVGPGRLPPLYSIYDEAVGIDEFPSNDDDPTRCYGTSVRAGCKVLQRLGLITEYKWLFSVDEVLKWILGGHGGLNLGIDWYSGMNEPDAEGIIRMKGSHQGGHAIYAFGADTSGEHEFLELQQSWGSEWGGWPTHTGPLPNKKFFKGCARLPLSDLKRLLDGNGEAVAIVEAPYVRRFPR